mgnify:FL=1
MTPLAWALIGWLALVWGWVAYDVWRLRAAARWQARVLAAIEEQRRIMAEQYWRRQRACQDALLIDLVLSESGTTETYHDDLESWI